MGVLRCNYCGGELEVNAELTVGKCKYCDSLITIPKALDRKGNLYNRAVFLRQNKEFDKASETYEDILKEDNSDAEAHWGLVLSKYGIEYVVDPKNQERIPTCHRTQAQSILADPDYLAAIEKSDIESRQVIENEAQRIHEIQSRIIELSQKEETYDIFICYKETDERDNRTEDSTIAQEIYYELEKKGYRVFFARKTLESKIGSEYEPIIFAALNSAKVMIVLGTKAEYFNAVWVRNEWSRFQKLSKETSKTIIPVYRNMSPYELPTELSTLQSLDSSKIGFMQDLVDGIERCMRQGNNHFMQKTNDYSKEENSILEHHIKNGDTYLRLSNYTMAEDVYTEITKENPEDYRGWWGLIVCKTKNFTELFKDKVQLDTWYNYVKQLADKEKFRELEEIYAKYRIYFAYYDAEEDIKKANEMISLCTRNMQEYETSIQNRNSKMKQREEEWEKVKSVDMDKMKECESALSKLQHNKDLCVTGIKAGGALVVLAVILFILESEIYLVAILFAVLFFSLAGITPSKMEIQQAENKKQETDCIFQEHERAFMSEFAEYKKELQQVEKYIPVQAEKIECCKRYIELGKETIVDFWYAKECELIDVKKSYDKKIEEYREMALGKIG